MDLRLAVRLSGNNPRPDSQPWAALRDVDGEILTFLQLSLASLSIMTFLPFLLLGRSIPWAITMLVLVHTVLALYIYMDGLKKVEVNELHPSAT